MVLDNTMAKNKLNKIPNYCECKRNHGKCEIWQKKVWQNGRFFANMCNFTPYALLSRFPLFSILGKMCLRLVNADCFYQVAHRFSLCNSWASCTYGTRSLTTNHLQLSLKYKRSTIRAEISYPILGETPFQILGEKSGFCPTVGINPPSSSFERPQIEKNVHFASYLEHFIFSSFFTETFMKP